MSIETIDSHSSAIWFVSSSAIQWRMVKEKKASLDRNENCRWLFVDWTVVDLSLMFWTLWTSMVTASRGLNCTLLPKQRNQHKNPKEKPQRKLTVQPDRAPTGARKTSREKINICDADDESHRQCDIQLFSCNTTSFFFERFITTIIIIVILFGITLLWKRYAAILNSRFGHSSFHSNPL